MAKKIRVWDGTQWQDVAPSLPYTAIHSAQASMPATGVDGQVWLDTDGTLAGQDFVPLSGGTMTGNLNVPSINSGPIVGRNKVLNGDFSIWQRGTSFNNPGGVFTADRWDLSYDGSGTTRTVSRQAFTPGTAPVSGYEGTYFYRYYRSGGSGGTVDYLLRQKIEDVRTLAGQTVTVSFWAKADVPRNMGLDFFQLFGTGGSSNLYVGVGTYGLTTSWQRFTTTVTLPSVTGKTINNLDSALLLSYYVVSSNATWTIDIWGVQLEAGNQATPFHTATPNQQTELAACQRYYYNINFQNNTRNGYNMMGGGLIQSSTRAYLIVNLPVVMRIAPSSITYSGNFLIDDGVNPYNVSNITLNQSGTSTCLLDLTSSGMTAYRPFIVYSNNDTNARISFNAEL